MKKVYSVFLALCLLLLLSACGQDDSAQNADDGRFCVECGEEMSSTDKFCNSCGASVNKQTQEQTQTQVHVHSYSNANCTEAAKCFCGATNGYPLGHIYTNGFCSRCGSKDSNYVKTYSVGETWIVDDQWEFTINSVTNHSLCNSYHNERHNYKNEQVIIIDYTYKNTGYRGNIQDLYISATSFYVYDQDGTCAEMYACTHTNSPKVCAVGTRCTAQESFVLATTSSKITLVVSEYTSNNLGTVKATFELDISQHTHSFSSWETTVTATCSKAGAKERYCSCGKKETQTIDKKAHDFKDGKCASCGEADPNYKTPDVILGEYVQKHGEKQSDGKYVLSFYPYSDSKSTITQIYWDPTDQSLLFAEQSSTSIGVTTAGIIYEYGAFGSKQKITFINDQTSTGYKITAIGYIYINTYSNSDKNIYSFSCDASGSLVNATKDLAQTGILMLVSHIDDYLETKTELDIKDFGFLKWTW